MHPPYRWQRARRWLDEELPVLEARTGVVVAIENMFPVRMGRRSMTFHANQDLDELEGLPHLVLDTSHAAVAEHDPVEVRRRFGERLRHVHLSDNAGKGWDSHLPPGEGVLDLDAFCDDLVADGYAGAVSLEVDLRISPIRSGCARSWSRCGSAPSGRSASGSPTAPDATAGPASLPRPCADRP